MAEIWHKTGLDRQEIIDKAHENTLVETLDIKITEIGDDFIKGTMPVDSRTKQPAGLLHGGASMALAETLASTGAYLCVDPEKYRVVGQEINANHVRSATSGNVTGIARPVFLGKRTQVWEIKIYKSEEEFSDKTLCCISRMTAQRIDGGQQ